MKLIGALQIIQPVPDRYRAGELAPLDAVAEIAVLRPHRWWKSIASPQEAMVVMQTIEKLLEDVQ